MVKEICGLADHGGDFADLVTHMGDNFSRWSNFLDQNNAESFVPLDWYHAPEG